MNEDFKAKLEAKLTAFRQWTQPRQFKSVRLVHYVGRVASAIDVPDDGVEGQIEGLVCEGFYVDWSEHAGRLYLRVWEYGGPEPDWPSVYEENSLFWLQSIPVQEPALDEGTHSKIRELCARGDALAEQDQFEEAAGSYREALALVPPPAEQWKTTTWIQAAIGNFCFHANTPQQALDALSEAVRCPDGLGNPFIHMRMGQCYLDLGQETQAADELIGAYLTAGKDLFKNEDPKYTRFLKIHFEPRFGQSDL